MTITSNAVLVCKAMENLLYATLRKEQQSKAILQGSLLGELDVRHTLIYDTVTKAVGALVEHGSHEFYMMVEIRVFGTKLESPNVSIDLKIKYTLEEVANQDLAEKAKIAATAALSDTFATKVLDSMQVIGVSYKFW